jgi:hypothetical protein
MVVGIGDGKQVRRTVSAQPGTMEEYRRREPVGKTVLGEASTVVDNGGGEQLRRTVLTHIGTVEGFRMRDGHETLYWVRYHQWWSIVVLVDLRWG